MEEFLHENGYKIDEKDAQLLFFRIDRYKDKILDYEEFREIFMWKGLEKGYELDNRRFGSLSTDKQYKEKPDMLFSKINSKYMKNNDNVNNKNESFYKARENKCVQGDQASNNNLSNVKINNDLNAPKESRFSLSRKKQNDNDYFYSQSEFNHNAKQAEDPVYNFTYNSPKSLNNFNQDPIKSSTFNLQSQNPPDYNTISYVNVDKTKKTSDPLKYSYLNNNNTYNFTYGSNIDREKINKEEVDMKKDFEGQNLGMSEHKYYDAPVKTNFVYGSGMTGMTISSKHLNMNLNNSVNKSLQNVNNDYYSPSRNQIDTYNSIQTLLPNEIGNV